MLSASVSGYVSVGCTSAYVSLASPTTTVLQLLVSQLLRPAFIPNMLFIVAQATMIFPMVTKQELHSGQVSIHSKPANIDEGLLCTKKSPSHPLTHMSLFSGFQETFSGSDMLQLFVCQITEPKCSQLHYTCIQVIIMYNLHYTL